MIFAEMAAAGHRFGGGGTDLGIGVAQEEHAVAHEKVDVLIAVHTPFAGAFGPSKVDRHRREVAQIVPNSTGENVASALMKFTALRPPGRVRLQDVDRNTHFGTT